MARNYPEKLVEFDIENFRKKLIIWGQHNFRKFPWRETHNPYELLVAETLLHRTQAKQVIEVYLNFIKCYPNILSIYKASESEIKELLKSLGLFWRIRLLKAMATELVKRFDRKVPEERESLLSLPGVGDYIASSVRCFGFNQPDAIIDTNVMRVITRIFDIQFKDSLRRNKKFMILAQRLLDPINPREYNFAMLDLANQVCRPKAPECHICPVKEFCHYYRKIFHETLPSVDSTEKF